ncbi:YdeI/OmpD-associated family protein [Gordonia sp. (in: high G+C Gram-positive bacteria)]|uniref:YdeI/OmpD-associated family protein n=1 Tax=Gordonia sp. (in: high G+C Gram-positive bacteria) TaxID=84139 RepID=UPI0039E6D84E
MGTPKSEPVEFTGRVSAIGERLVVRLPAEASAALPSRGQVAATVTVAGHTADTVVEPDGRRGHWLPADGLAGLGEGDDAAIRVVPTKEWPEPVRPDDFAAALAGAPDIADLWEAITPMARWEWVRWINATKNPQTRQRRIEVAVDKLRNGKRRPCCFDLSSCTDPEVATSGKLIEA